MKKIIVLLMILLLIGGCSSVKEQETVEETEPTEGELFKEAYESLNGLQDIKYPDQVYRTVEIDADNPYVQISMDDLMAKIKNDETFYVYFGDPKCPWCRSNIETAVKEAKEEGIATIYYVHMWDENREEIVRDKYEIVEDELTQTFEGSDGYHTLVGILDQYLNEYIVQDDEGNSYDTGEKRIVMPSYVHFTDGEVDKYSEGTASSQSNSHASLTDEIISEQSEEFDTFFNQNKACSLNSKGC